MKKISSLRLGLAFTGSFLGAGCLLAAHYAEQAETYIPDAAARMGVYLKK